MSGALAYGINNRPTDDQEILAALRKGDKNALGELFRRYSVLVLGLCIKYLKNRDSAEDMTMKIFELLPSKISASEISQFRGWLYTVSRNECLMELRRKNPKLKSEDFLWSSEDQSEAELISKQIEEQRIELLEKALTQLGADQRKCIELFYLKEKSYDEICELSGLDFKEVKSHIQNGKRNLKLIFERQNEL